MRAGNGICGGKCVCGAVDVDCIATNWMISITSLIMTML